MSNDNQSNRYKQLESDNNIKIAATRHLNFGVAIFVMIFAYLVFVLITFAVKDKVNYTIAEPGILTHSNTFKGLIIKSEEVVLADDSGDVRFFFTEGARVRNGNTVATIINDPEMAGLLDEQIFNMNQSLDADDPAFDESYEYLQGRIKSYVINQHRQPFESTYAIKNEITKDIENIRNTVILQQNSLNLASGNDIGILEAALNEQTLQVKAPSSGLISFKMDGMEDITIDNFTTADLDRTPNVAELSLQTQTQKDTPLFKVVDNYLWYIVAEIDDECEKQISGKKYIGIEIVDKDINIDVKSYTWDAGDKTYIRLEVDRKLGEFLGNRFIDFQIVYNEHEGIKIPETAIAKAEFAIVPQKYMTMINGENRVHKVIYDEETPGLESIDGVSVKMFTYDENGNVLIPISSDLEVGDLLNYTDPETMITDRFVISDTVILDGVYVVNKGYAVFKFIETMFRELDYRIVETNTKYGIRMYDRIATEGSKTEAYQIIH